MFIALRPDSVVPGLALVGTNVKAPKLNQELLASIRAKVQELKLKLQALRPTQHNVRKGLERGYKSCTSKPSCTSEPTAGWLRCFLSNFDFSYHNNLCCCEVAYSHACSLAASFPRERPTCSTSPTTLRGGAEACEPGLRLGDKPPNPPRTQLLEPADPANPSGKPARDRLNDANLRVPKRNSSKPARAAS